ncbi:two-component sensor histidine kinase [Constrictibacter sp. MBR-5]|jgi:two-component sensor histidine kinase|uniref:sensor histidine kinase n=1 Tax=Constrictibacter sp. MBR-5 TaxID=3156467 RepID=UPI003391E401
MPPGEIEAFLDFLQEPTFILTGAGEVVAANHAARRIAGGDAVGRQLTDLAASPGEEVRTYLGRCSGSAQPSVGALVLRDAQGGTPRYRVYGARLRGDALRLAIRCVPAESGEFSILARKVQELNAEIHARRRTQAGLEEALRRNETLLRELHHRVKNNIQLILGLFSAAERETNSQEVKTFLSDAKRRLIAIGTAQNLMYQSQQMRTLSLGPLLRALCEAIGVAFRTAGRIEVRTVDADVSNETAFPLALIVNELVTNAFKHGCPSAESVVEIVMDRDGADFVLSVRDGGPGIAADAPGRRSSGLGLVQGLCRQIGGSFTVENAGGARCIVRFPARTIEEVGA